METVQKFVGSIALIRHPESPESSWLAYHSQQRDVLLRLVTSERLEGESYRECIEREIAWELRLRRGKDYIVSRVPRLHFEQPVQIPGEPEPVYFIVEFFVVDLYGSAARVTVEKRRQGTLAELSGVTRRHDTRWLSHRRAGCHAAPPFRCDSPPHALILSRISCHVLLSPRAVDE